jgi:hypothetical protein
MMMVMKIKKILLFVSIAFFSQGIFAQDDTFGVWYGADASYKIIKGLKAEVAGSLRTDQNGSNVESFYFEGGLNYRFNKYLSAGAHYRLIEKKEDDSLFYFRHRLYADIKGTLPLGRFTLSARYRFQEQLKMYIKNEDDKKPEFYNRLRFELDYNIPKIPLTPSVYTEFLGQTFKSNDIMFEKSRVGAGLKYDITKKQSVSAEYIYLTSKVTSPEYFNVLSLNYSVNF